MPALSDTPRPKALVAMSGGVDSSVAAALLQRQGYDCVGVFMRLGSPGEALEELIPGDAAACAPARIGKQGCCSINDAADARLVAAQLGIPFYVVNFKREFGRIIDYFVDEYAAGRTPNPCVRCNDWLKFGKLHEYADQIGAAFVASGHYARIEPAPDAPKGGILAALSKHAPRPDQSSTPTDAGPEEALHPREGRRRSGSANPSPRLLRGLDHAKDQSYVLFGVPRGQLAKMLLPIGGHRKAEIREMARELSLPVFDKPDSQEICFVPDNDYAGLVERRRPGLVKAGAVVDESGLEVGAHEGQHRFTIGQRRGVGVALGRPLYVVGKDVNTNTVTLGSREALRVQGCHVHEANWLADVPGSGEWFAAWARHRSNGALVAARVRVAPDAAPGPSGRPGAFEVEFESPQEAVAPGQALVLYDAGEPEMVIGGGWIASASR